MGYPLIDETGNRHGRWTVIRQGRDRPMPSRPGHFWIYWLCRCDCGLEREVGGHSLRAGQSRGCRDCAIAARKAAARGPTTCACGRPTTAGHSRARLRTNPNPRECGACKRAASRHGRGDDGRPLRDPAFVAIPADGTCAACGEERGSEHSPFCGACRGPALRIRATNRDRLRHRRVVSQ